jgi:hypothetical protein
MILELSAGNWSEALSHAEESLANRGHGEDRELVEAVQAFTAERTGHPEAIDLINDLNVNSFSRWSRAGEYRIAAMAVLHLYMKDTLRAIPYIEAQLNDPSPPDDRFFLVYLTYLETLRRLAESIDDPTNPDAPPPDEALFDAPGMYVTPDHWRDLPTEKRDPAWLLSEMDRGVTLGLSYQPKSAALQAFARRVFGDGEDGLERITTSAAQMRSFREFLAAQQNAFGSANPLGSFDDAR